MSVDWIKYIGCRTIINLFEQHLHKDVTKDLVLSCIPDNEFLPYVNDDLAEFKDEVCKFVLRNLNDSISRS